MLDPCHGGGNRYSRSINWNVLILDLILMNVAFWGIFYLRLLSGRGEWSCHPLFLDLILTACLFFSILSGKMVFLERGVRAEDVLANVFRMVLRFAAYSIFVLVVINFDVDSMRWLFVMYIVTFVFIVTLHLVARRMLGKSRARGIDHFSTVFVGVTDEITELSAYLKNSISVGVTVAGYFNDVEDEALSKNCPYLGGYEDVIPYMENQTKPNQVFCASSGPASAYAKELMRWCRQNVVLFSVVPAMPRYLNHRVYLQRVGDVFTLAFMNDPLMDPVNKFFKRAFDICVSGLFLCTLFPFIFIFVAIGTKLTSKGPIFFKQKRTGIDGKEFTCLKFRSMKVNAQADTLQATEHDPRKTKFGDFIRKTSLDEFPQFINVFIGDMSIVGPRPHMVMHTEEYSALIKKYMVRHFVKPGITGWAQVTGYRGETKTLEQMEGRIKADIWYIENWSFWLDIVILFKTFVQVFVKGDDQAY